MSYAIRYTGRVGDPANNDSGQWAAGEVRPVGTEFGEVPEKKAREYVESGMFEWLKNGEPVAGPIVAALEKLQQVQEKIDAKIAEGRNVTTHDAAVLAQNIKTAERGVKKPGPAGDPAPQELREAVAAASDQVTSVAAKVVPPKKKR